MKLYIVRHGPAGSAERWESADADRPLTDEGRRHVRAVAGAFRTLGLQPVSILTSPFARARETAEIVAAALDAPVEADDALMADQPGSLLARVTPLLLAHRHEEELMLVGHEPDLSELAGQLITAATPAHLILGKGDCCRVDLPLGEGPVPGTLVDKGRLAWLLPADALLRLQGEA